MHLNTKSTPGLKPQRYTAWPLLTAYWRSNHRLFAAFLAASVLAFTLSIIGLEVVFSYWHNHFYNALQAYNKKNTISLLTVFLFLAATFIILSVYRYYVSSFLSLRWRQWLTQQFIQRWLENRSYYYLEHFDQNTDNPDQRIQEDVGSLVTLTLGLVTGVVVAVTTFFGFIYILWTLSGPFKLHLGSLTMALPGYLVWVSLAYSLFGTYMAFKLGRPLLSLNFEQQRREANFRFSAIDLRTHTEAVALYRGEKNQINLLSKSFGSVLENWYQLITRQKILLWFTSGYGQMAVCLPLLAVLPNYFNKVFLLGGLMQTLGAFGHIQNSLSFFVNSFATVAEWRAVLKRLLTFLNHIYEMEEKAGLGNRLKVKSLSSTELRLRDLSLTTPEGVSLLSKINLHFKRGESCLLKGPSGIGKSTLLRTLAGIWPFAAGELDLPETGTSLYLPQKPYLPLGTLREALLFPSHTREVSDEDLNKLLETCRLEKLKDRLQESAPWAELLSPGELQRINFARIFLHEPEWIFLDESTASLDVENERYFYQLLKTRLPNATVISVAHRSTLEAFHERIIDLNAFTLQEAVLVA